MYLNTDSTLEPARRPCLRDLATLTATLLPPALVMLAPLAELERRCHEINATHPRYREETPLVLAYEHRRRDQFSGVLRLAGPPAGPVRMDAQPASRA
ncbi:hypothetical protein [Hymenobacter psychrotolerans]|uniref:Uncharacterized protein n=1 Tax=Hymenobacter psychrotolerans DSM 18569 TaxID=1121959 RepID=A0A1M7E5K6_9BACT|nr:hypothetical protein [Hymenobacter psychrotolerans]SHL86980.1 hypothetical protein SAMN02746009_03522 [Hymenobacter psychrotolerans DSM 18569]